MKTRNLVFILAVSAITFTFVSCSESLNDVEDSIFSGEEKSAGIVANQADKRSFNQTLTENEMEGLMEMREEEKLAGDVYSTLYNTWNQIIFSNIAKSESAHTKAVLNLINIYGLTDPALPGVGEFANPLFADLFFQLTEKGSESLVEALKIGAFIEEYDIADLQRLLLETQNKDIIRVYENLLVGSKNHLRAFTYSLERLGETYTPTIISTEEYQEILNK